MFLLVSLVGNEIELVTPFPSAALESCSELCYSCTFSFFFFKEVVGDRNENMYNIPVCQVYWQLLLKSVVCLVWDCVDVAT